MTRKIYDQHEKAFAQVSAFIIMQNNERVATVAFKFPRDGAGRLSCFLHVLGLPMVKGIAGGYGYDKKSAAFTDAARKADKVKLESWQSEGGYSREREIASLMRAAMVYDGSSWEDALRKVGFTVLQAV